MALHTHEVETRSDSGAPQPKKVATVKIWAVLGALVMAFEAYVLIKWVTGPNFERVPAGPTPVPMGIKIAATAVTALGFPAMLWCFWQWVVKPWRRSRIVTSEGLLLTWFATFAWFLDPFANYFNAFFTYNAWLPNMGSWVADVPGWASITAGSPGRMQAYPLLFVVTAYVWGLFGVIVFLAWCMRKLRARYPRMSTPMLVFISYWNGFLVFLLLEIVYMRAGIYGYHGTVPELTLWYGEYYQMPIYEALYAGLWCLGYSCLMYFRNDKGQTLAERGIERVRTGQAGQLGLRFAAMTAICTGIYMVSYNIPYWITNNLNEAWPKEAQINSYWTNYICGPETDQACPSPDLPITKRNSGHFDPEGNFIVKDGQPVPRDADQYTEFRK
jgi:hypothetical protein